MTPNTNAQTTGTTRRDATTTRQGWTPARRLLSSALAATTLFAISVASAAPAFANQWCTSC